MDFKNVKAYVCPIPAYAPQITRIKREIRAAGGTLICDAKTDLSDWQNCVDRCDVVVILMCPEAGAAEYAEVIEYATKAGKQVIGVWPEGAASDTIPDTIDREGDGAVPPEYLCDAETDGEKRWRLSDGKVRKEQKTPRHRG